MAHGNELYLATLISGRYANQSQTAAVIETEEFGRVACSETDFPYLWDRRTEIEMAPFEVVGPPEPVPTIQEAEEQRHESPVVPSDEPNVTGVIGQPAPLPLPEPERPVVGDWRAAIRAMEGSSPSDDDFGIGMDLEPDELPPLPDPEATDEPVIEEKPQVLVEPSPPPPEPPATKTVVIAEQKTIDDSSWGKAEIAYQVAIQAKNGSAIHRGLLVEPAARRGLSVEDLADEIIRKRHETVQRVMSEF